MLAPFVAYARTKYFVLGVNPIRLLLNEPVPVPSFVFASLIVGLFAVLQQTPLAEIGEPPSDEIIPPLVAVVVVMLLTEVVVREGALP